MPISTSSICSSCWLAFISLSGTAKKKLFVSFVTAWVLAGAAAIAWHFYGGSWLWGAIVTAATLWAGFTAARFITHDQFDRRTTGLTVLNCAHELVTIVIMGIIIGVWPA